MDLDAVQADLASVVQQALEPAHVSVWMNSLDEAGLDIEGLGPADPGPQLFEVARTDPGGLRLDAAPDRVQRPTA